MSNSASLNGGATLFLTTRTRTRLPTRLGALLERLDAADVEPDRGVELERPPAGSDLGVAEHDADLLPELVDEDRGRLGLADGAGQLAQGLAHEPGLEADVRVAHLPLELGPWGQRRHRVDDHDVERAAADEQLGDLQRLLAIVGLRDQQLVDVDARCAGNMRSPWRARRR